MPVIRGSAWLTCLVILASGAVSLFGGGGLAEYLAVAGYVGLIVLALSWSAIAVRRLTCGRRAERR